MNLIFRDNIKQYNKLFDIMKGETNMETVAHDIILWSKVKEDAIIPSKRFEDAGWDIYASFADKGDSPYYIIEPFETFKIPTGIATAFNPAYYMKIEERSSTGSRGIKISSGIIDSGYRGEITIMLYNASNKYLVVSKDEDIFNTIRRNLSNITGDTEEFAIKYDDFEFVNANKAIAQAIVMPLAPIHNSDEVSYEDLCNNYSSERGTGKLGSTGK